MKDRRIQKVLTPLLLFSVEPDSKKLSRHGSVEIFDAAYNLIVPNILSRNQNFLTSLKIFFLTN